MASEKLLERTFAEKLNATKKVWCIKLPATYVAGLPDRVVFCKGGFVGFAEIKTTGQKPRLIQEVIHKRLRALGFEVLIVDDYESRDAAIAFFLNKVNE